MTQRHPHSTAPWRSPSRTVAAPHAPLPAAGQANASQADLLGLTVSVSVSASQHLIIEVLRRPVEFTLYAAQLDGDGAAERGHALEFPRAEFDQVSPRFSPNARFLAYRSDDSGRDEVYVRPFDPSDTGAVDGGPWQISDQGGLGMIHWREDGRQLYYLGTDGHMMAVDVTTTGMFTAGAPRRLFPVPDTIPLVGPQARFSRGLGSMRGDGRRIVFAVPEPPERPEIAVAPEILATFAGTYENAFGAAVTVRLEGNRLWAEGMGTKRPMLAASESSFYFETYNGELDFVTDDHGQVTHVMLHAFGVGGKWTRK